MDNEHLTLETLITRIACNVKIAKIDEICVNKLILDLYGLDIYESNKEKEVVCIMCDRKDTISIQLQHN